MAEGVAEDQARHASVTSASGKSSDDPVVKPTGPIGFWAQLREDWIRHDRTITKPGLWAVIIYRLGRRISTMPKVLRLPLMLVHRPAFWFVRNCCGIELPHTAQVGRRFLIGHQSGIVIHHHAVIGDDCLVRQNVTIGAGAAWNADKAPQLGNGVEVGAGAVIIGPVKIGDNVRIGPNAVVTTNIPAGSIVVVPPPRVIVPPVRKPSPKD